MTITTEDGNRQNMFAVEPKMYITEKDMAEHQQETYAQRAEKLKYFLEYSETLTQLCYTKRLCSI